MKSIIFDCDGTLVDSERLSTEILVTYVAEHGLKISLAEALTICRGAKMDICVKQLERRLGATLPPTFVPEYRSRMTAAFQRQLKPIDGALELVRSLSHKYCVASNGPREKTELSLSLTGLLPFFHSAIFSSYEVGAWKPDPRLFLHAAESMGVNPATCMVVEDSLPGIEAGIAAGMEVIAFQPHDVDDRIPDNVTVIRHLSELNAHLSASV
ncbi:HAD family hydrolase [Schlesneria paludicola]|uniref:HAD family hydrolase n=1 Tax=Schlesneria paludicola TaxID=360056 RepID=UPI000492BA3E|nr:HAD-IA family hydrolase [Schlesneria paludicola]